MIIIGIDYGVRKVGVSLAVGPMASPLCVVRAESEAGLVEKVKAVLAKELAERVVVGVSEGMMAQRAEIFASEIAEATGLPVTMVDETLTTKEAQMYAREAGIKQKKRRAMEDAYSATLILQRYLDDVDKV